MNLQRRTPSCPSAYLAFGVVCALSVTACGGAGGGSTVADGGSQMQQQTTATLTDTALVASNTGVAAKATTIDANLSNPWGLVTAPGLPFWVADNNSNVATLYSGTGAIQTGEVTGSNDVGISIPASAAGLAANPTGQVYNGSGGFLIPTSSGNETALFMFAGEGGTVAAWAKDSGAAAVSVYDDGVINGAGHAVYKGLALGSVNGTTYLYATDLHNNKVDVFDTSFAKPAAMQDGAMHDEVTGAGLGYVDIFDFSGNLVSRFASAGALNAPWGIALAPAGFGSFEGDLLIGNFGDGKINIFAPNGSSVATSMGALTDNNGQTLAFPGLWSLVFGDGDSDKPLTTLFYTAGFADQTDGVLGSITATSTATSTPAPAPY